MTKPFTHTLELVGICPNCQRGCYTNWFEIKCSQCDQGYAYNHGLTVESARQYARYAVLSSYSQSTPQPKEEEITRLRNLFQDGVRTLYYHTEIGNWSSGVWSQSETTQLPRSGWLGKELNDKPCTYGIPKDPEGDPRDTKQCGKPSVYKAVGGFEYCQEHAPEVAENDEIYLPRESKGEKPNDQT